MLQLCAALKTNLVTVTTISTQSDFERSLSETGTQTSTHFNETGSQTSTHFDADTILNDIGRYLSRVPLRPKHSALQQR